MPEQIKLPALSETVDTGIVGNVLVSVGDVIEEGQPIIEIEADKAVVEVPAPFGGTVTAIHVEAGQEVKVGQPLITVETAAAAEAVPEPVPTLQPEQGAVESAPATTSTPPSPPPAPQTVQPPSRVSTPSAPVSGVTAVSGVSAVGDGGTGGKKLVPASPAVRRFARELGVDITQVPGTGPGGRISIDDVKAFVSRSRAAQVNEGAVPITEVPKLEVPDFSQWGPVEIKPMSSVRRATARQTVGAWVSIPHVTHYDVADITELDKIRRQYAPKAEAAGGKLTITAIIVKVVASALKVFPKFNTSLDMENNRIIYKKYYHIGVAVDTEHGLLVPVIRDVDRKNLIELSVELTEVSQRARERKLGLEEMRGGCITVSNLGGIGGTHFSPIINAPEVAIVGVGRSRIEPVYENGEFVPRLMLPLALSYDHRVIDGADGARFLRWIAEALADPFMMTLEG